MKIVAVLNQKGGVGKTTVSTNLSHALSLTGKKVLAIDLDPQGHLAASLGIFKPPVHGIYDVMMGQQAFEAVKIDSREGLQLVPSGARLRELEEAPGEFRQKMGYLKKALDNVPEGFDYVLLDCPPSSGILVANAILAVDEIIIPVSGDYLSLNGLAHLMITLKRFDAAREKPLKKHIVLSRFVYRRRLSKEVQDKLLQYFPGMVLKTPIREAAALAECPGAGRTIFEYRGGSSSAEDFKNLARDLVKGKTLK
jgi:chromosome partitioning protein